MAKKKKHLTKNEEFEIMKIVLDKFVLLGVIILAMGLYMIVATNQNIALGFSVLAAGVIIMVLFAILMVKEYNFLKD